MENHTYIAYRQPAVFDADEPLISFDDSEDGESRITVSRIHPKDLAHMLT